MFKLLLNRNKKLGVLTFLFLILYAAYNPVLSKLIQYNMLVAEGKGKLNLINLLLINLIVFVILSLVNWLSQYFSIKFYTSSQNELNKLCFKKLIDSNQTNYSNAEIVQLFNNDIPLIVASYIPAIISLVYFIFSFCFGAILILSPMSITS